MRLALVLNRSAGSFRRLAPDATARAITAILAAAGHDVECLSAGRGDLAGVMAGLAGRPDLDAVVVGGGDGTFLAALGAGLGHRLPLGLLPLGTLNLFARDLGLPLDPLDAATRLSRARPVSIDLAEVNGQPFAIWASLGMHPWAVRRRDHLQRDGMGKWRATALAALRTFVHFPHVEIRVDTQQGPRWVTAPMLFVTNNAWRDQTPPLRRATLDGGTLEIHIVTCRSRLSLLLLAIEAMLGRWRRSRRIETLVRREVRLVGSRRRLMVSLDGEVTALDTPLLFRARPMSLRVLMPEREDA